MKKSNHVITLDRLRDVLHYDPNVGTWTWRKTLSVRRPAGRRAGEIKQNGYEFIGLDGARYRSHRLAWFYMTGRWPAQQIDHIDGNRSNNRWNNLRQATNLQNSRNRGANKNNRSGYKGVFWSTQIGRWQARINFGGKQRHLGTFDNPLAASEAYRAAAATHFGEYGTRSVAPVQR